MPQTSTPPAASSQAPALPGGDDRCEPRQQPQEAGEPAPCRRRYRRQIAAGDRRIIGVMVESHLVGGRQDLVPGKPLVYGQSITDGCIDWEESVEYSNAWRLPWRQGAKASRPRPAPALRGSARLDRGNCARGAMRQEDKACRSQPKRAKAQCVSIFVTKLSTTGRILLTMTRTPSAFGCNLSGRVKAVSPATPSRKKG